MSVRVLSSCLHGRPEGPASGELSVVDGQRAGHENQLDSHALKSKESSWKANAPGREEADILGGVFRGLCGP